MLFDLDNTLIVRHIAIRKLSYYVNRFYFADRPAEHERIADIFCEIYKSGYDDLRECFIKFRAATNWTHRAGYREFDRFWNFYYPYCSTPDAEVPALAELTRKGYRIAILTNGSSVLQQSKTDVAGFRDMFECVIATDEAGPEKPDPAPFLYAARRMGLEPREIAYVGDHPVNDMQGARRVGMRTVWMRKYSEWSGVVPDAEAEVGSLGELTGLFEDISRNTDGNN